MTFDAHEVEDIEIDESAERHLFALRARVAPNEPAPPPMATVFAAIEKDVSATRSRRTLPRVIVGALAVAACTAALFATARALSPVHERIVAERIDASSPSAPFSIPRTAIVEGVGDGVCSAERSTDVGSDETCESSPAPLASYAVLEPMCIGVASFGAPSSDDTSSHACALESSCSIARP